MCRATMGSSIVVHMIALCDTWTYLCRAICANSTILGSGPLFTIPIMISPNPNLLNPKPSSQSEWVREGLAVSIQATMSIPPAKGHTCCMHKTQRKGHICTFTQLFDSMYSTSTIFHVPRASWQTIQVNEFKSETFNSMDYPHDKIMDLL